MKLAVEQDSLCQCQPAADECVPVADGDGNAGAAAAAAGAAHDAGQLAQWHW